MPKVTKQVPKSPWTQIQTSKSNGQPPRGQFSSVLDRILDMADITTGIKLNVYGRGKTGKTRLACTFPKPLLLIGTEDGRKSVSNVSGGQFIRIKASAELEPLVDLLKGGKYKTVVLDTAGGLQDMIVKEVLGLEEIPIQRSWGMAQQKDWGIIGQQTKERLSSLLTLADTHNLNVVVIAHERSFGDTENSEVMVPSVGSALTPTAAAWLNGACDYICQCFIREETRAKSINVAGQKQEVLEKTGKVQFCLRIGPHPVYATGFRVPEGVALPDLIIDPHYSKINALIQGK